MPFCPVNQSTPWRSKVAVLRLALRRSLGSGKSLTARVAESTWVIAFCPPSVTQAAPSGPTITPWGAAPGPSARDVRWHDPGAGGMNQRRGWGWAALHAVTVTFVKLVIPVEAVDCKSTIRLQINP